MTLLLIACAAFCLAGCRKTNEEKKQEETITSQEEAAEEETLGEEDDKKLQYQETIEMELGEDQEGSATPAE